MCSRCCWSTWPFSPSSLKTPFPPDWPKPLLVTPNNSNSSTSWVLEMCLWQEEAQELEAALVTFPSWASSVFGESRDEFLLVLPLLLHASSGCVLYFLTAGWSCPWELPSFCACSPCWAPWALLVQLSQGQQWARSGNSKPRLFLTWIPSLIQVSVQLWASPDGSKATASF